MNRLCCFPLSEPPEVTVKVNCVSTCCASEMRSKEEFVSDIANGASHVERSNKCCCGKKRKSSKPQAKDEGKNMKLKDE